MSCGDGVLTEPHYLCYIGGPIGTLTLPVRREQTLTPVARCHTSASAWHDVSSLCTYGRMSWFIAQMHDDGRMTAKIKNKNTGGILAVFAGNLQPERRGVAGRDQGLRR